jgi:pilus assembly protein CpaF
MSDVAIPPSTASAPGKLDSGGDLTAAVERLWPAVERAFESQTARDLSHSQLAMHVGTIVAEQADLLQGQMSLKDRRLLIEQLVTRLSAAAAQQQGRDIPAGAGAGRGQATGIQRRPSNDSIFYARANRSGIDQAMLEVQPVIVQRIDVTAAAKLSRDELGRQLNGLVAEILAERNVRLNGSEQEELIRLLLDDMLGLGPLEPLLADETITDVMVNGPRRVFIERKGRIEETNVRFRDNQHLMNIATRIVSQIGRRIDESSPLCDARLADGSRVNIIVPPLAIDGPSISIRKFSKQRITLDGMVALGSLTSQLATVIKIAGRCRLNVIISGGTGSGKTTLLNAMSQLIDPAERIVTIEDAAELQLDHGDMVRLESRPPNIEGGGEITIRDLLRNALRMRPDRIIIGEVRGAEAVDMLQAMNTGHDGSLSTIHANNPRETLTRIENMVGLAGVNLSPRSVRTQIAAALDMIVQVTRMRDGVRRVTNVVEVVGMEGDVITLQDLFSYEYEGESADGRLMGKFVASGMRPHCLAKAQYFGLERSLMEALA